MSTVENAETGTKSLYWLLGFQGRRDEQCAKASLEGLVIIILSGTSDPWQGSVTRAGQPQRISSRSVLPTRKRSSLIVSITRYVCQERARRVQDTTLGTSLAFTPVTRKSHHDSTSCLNIIRRLGQCSKMWKASFSSPG